MRHVEVIAHISGRGVRELFPLARDMRQYPRYSETVLDLQVQALSADSAVSTWTVRFGPGKATWTQQDDFYPDTHSLRFRRLAGDIEHFTGTWTMRDCASGCRVEFAAEFDTRLFVLAAIVEPMIEKLLRDNISSILQGMIGPDVCLLQ